MAQQLTAPQQSYCEHISRGLNQSDAYKMAYPGSAAATIYSQSSRMAKLPHIMQEIERLREPVVQQQAWDRARLVRELWELSQSSRLKHPGTSVRCLELIGKACGLLIDRQEITASIRSESIVSLSTEQLLSLARQAQLAELESGTHALPAAGENGQAQAASSQQPGD
jgi:hypothetical protein